ncbi:MAG: hypothetical protein J0H39_13955 [Alphaproteobacteria bacterium]|nr:hypothetical protein [Alphaproteobacteria bacterium]
MAYAEYPKALYGAKGWDDLEDRRRVHNEAEESAARAEGYRTLGEIDADKANAALDAAPKVAAPEAAKPAPTKPAKKQAAPKVAAPEAAKPAPTKPAKKQAAPKVAAQ